MAAYFHRHGPFMSLHVAASSGRKSPKCDLSGRGVIPRFSIITVVFNHKSGLRATGESVVLQQFQDYEWIVVDGGSKDGTVAEVERFGDKVSKFISEPDRGIYDAMNKGLSIAEGEWIIFLNAGDQLADSGVLSNFCAPPDADLAYGDAVILRPDGARPVFKAKPLEEMWKGICFSHQSLFTRKHIAKKLRFSTRFKVVSDYDWYVRALSSGAKAHSLNYVVSEIEPGGFSERAFYRRTIERFFVASRHFGLGRVLPFYTALVLRRMKMDLLAARRG
jgi:glycosyltransferase involved in cell wall biosynthesis